MVCLDAVSIELSFTRRRLYDVVNILEAVAVVSRHGMNIYHWSGMARLAHAMHALDQAMRAHGAGYQQRDLNAIGHPIVSPEHAQQRQPTTRQIVFTTSDAGDHSASAVPLTKKQAKQAAKREAAATATTGQTLGHMTQVFLQMFLSNDSRIVTLDDAALWLLGVEAEADQNYTCQVSGSAPQRDQPCQCCACSSSAACSSVPHSLRRLPSLPVARCALL